MPAGMRGMPFNDAANAGNGYPISLFVVEPGEFLTCSICLQVLRVPVQCAAGHSFCKACIHAELSVRNSCPINQQTLEVKDLITNRSLAGVIDNLAVRCPTLSCSTGSTSAKRRKIRHSEENVCEWTSTLQEISNHLEECGWTEVRCSNPGCPEIVLRAMLPPHLSTCPEGHVPCQWYVR